MNKILIKKNEKIPRHHITYHYRKNRLTKSISNNQTNSVTQKKDNIVQRPKPISNSPKPISNSPKSKSTVIRAVSTRSTFIPKRNINRTKDTFDSSLSKLKSIRGVGKNKILAILAPGPSILQAEINRIIGIDNIDSMTINKPDLRYWPTKYWMFCDRTQYTRNKNEFHKYNGIIINTNSIKASHPNQIRIKNLQGRGFSIDMTKGFYIGRSTTFSSMQVAAWMDYEKIFIFGLDMCRVGKKLHSYGKNPDVPEEIREKRFEKESEFYDSASKIMSKDLRDKYYICSDYNPWPFVDRFNRVNQTEAIDLILKLSEEM